MLSLDVQGLKNLIVKVQGKAKLNLLQVTAGKILEKKTRLQMQVNRLIIGTFPFIIFHIYANLSRFLYKMEHCGS
jgi:hypothetical protein